jgi:flagellar motor switch protein FliM
MSPEMAQLTRAALGHTLGKARVSVDAVLGRAVLPLHEVARLQVGDIIQLDTNPEEPISVEVGGISRFDAKPGRRGEQSAVQLTGIVRD